MNLLSILRKEFDAKGIISPSCVIERFSSSIGCHIFNLINIENKKFYHGGQPDNFRQHIVMMSPSGYGRTFLFKLFLDPSYGLLKEVDSITTSVRSTFSAESWAGTIIGGDDGLLRTTKGVFSRYKDGIIGCDEFMRLGDMMNNMGVKHDEVYLMTGLDQSVITKDLSTGSIEEGDIGTTLWAGMRLSSIGLRSGFCRRFSFQLFFPTLEDSIKYKYANRDKRIKSCMSPTCYDKIRDTINTLIRNINKIEDIDYSMIDKWINGSKVIPHFEEVIYRRLALGYNIVTGNNRSTTIKLSIDDGLQNLFINEINARQIIRRDIESEVIVHILKANGGCVSLEELSTFLTTHYQYSVPEVDTMLASLRLYGRIDRVKGNICFKKSRYDT